MSACSASPMIHPPNAPPASAQRSPSSLPGLIRLRSSRIWGKGAPKLTHLGDAPGGAFAHGAARQGGGEQPMIDVYGMSTPNAVKITIMLEELGLPYRQHHVNVFAGEQHAREFLQISPNNKV